MATTETDAEPNRPDDEGEKRNMKYGLVAGVFLVLALAACSSASDSSFKPTIIARTATTYAVPTPQQTDPNGESCVFLDSQGYCPGDDPAPSSPSPTSCADQISAWKSSGASDQIDAIIGDLQNVQSSATAVVGDMSAGLDASADESGLQSAASSLQSDVQTLQGNLPPSCVPGLRSNLKVGLDYFNSSAIDASQGVTALSSGNQTMAGADFQASTAAMAKGDAKVQKATADANAYSNGQG